MSKLPAMVLVVVLSLMLGLMQPATAQPVKPLSTGHEQLFVGLQCNSQGFIIAYNGNMVQGTPNTLVETYFNFLNPNGSESYSHSVSHLRTNATGAVSTPTNYFKLSTFVAVQFNVYYAYPDDTLLQSQWRYCGGGGAAVSKGR